MNDPQQHVAAVAMLEMLQQNRLDSFLRKHDYFDGKEATRYLRNFNQEMKRSKLEDAEKIDMFISVVAASVEGRIKLIKTDKSWDEYQTAVKKTFRLHDSEKATAYTFMNWVNRSSKTEPIDEVFATFELKYTDLPPDERVELKDKCLLFVQAVSKHDRTHLIHKLMEGNERLTKSWEKVQQEVERCVAFQEISEHLDSDSADHQVPERKSPSQRNEPSNDIGSITQMMKDLQLQMLHLTKSQNTMIAKPQANVQTPRCVWCDSPAHRRRDCEACTQAIADRLVRVVDGKLHRVSDDKLLPAKFGRGGIQSYFEGAAAAVQLTNNNDEAEVYQCQLEPMNPLSSMNPPSVQPSISRQKVANVIRTRTGWNVPVSSWSVTSITNAMSSVDEKRAREMQDENEEVEKAKRNKRSKEEDKPTKRSYRLQSDLRKDTSFKQVLEERVLEAEITLSLRTLLGISDAEMHNHLIDILKRKRQVLETEDIHTSATELADSRVSRISVNSNEKDFLNSYWAKATGFTGIRLSNIPYEVEALVDYGSETNNISRQLYEEGLWPIELNCGWNMKTADKIRTPMHGACPSVSVTLGDITATHNFFVHNTLSYPVILGQPWIARMRTQQTTLADGSQWGQIKALDDSHQVQFLLVPSKHSRHRLRLHDHETDQEDF